MIFLSSPKLIREEQKVFQTTNFSSLEDTNRTGETGYFQKSFSIDDPSNSTISQTTNTPWYVYCRVHTFSYAHPGRWNWWGGGGWRDGIPQKKVFMKSGQRVVILNFWKVRRRWISTAKFIKISPTPTDLVPKLQGDSWQLPSLLTNK